MFVRSLLLQWWTLTHACLKECGSGCYINILPQAQLCRIIKHQQGSHALQCNCNSCNDQSRCILHLYAQLRSMQLRCCNSPPHPYQLDVVEQCESYCLVYVDIKVLQGQLMHTTLYSATIVLLCFAFVLDRVTMGYFTIRSLKFTTIWFGSRGSKLNCLKL